MFEVHGWFELRGARGEGELSDTEAQQAQRQLERLVRDDGDGDDRSDTSEWANGLLAAFSSNGHRFVHFARVWNHREPGEAAVRELAYRLWKAARGTRGRIDVLDHGRQGDRDWCEVWWFENGELEVAPADEARYRRWFA